MRIWIFIIELGLEYNPLTCNCSSKWIQRQISKSSTGKSLNILGQFWEKLTCLDEKSGETFPLANVSIPGCGES
jgi:hypothetical protein